MGLYLAIFDDNEEIDGVEVGQYADFGDFRDTVVRLLERGRAGSRFPTLILHSDCDGEWTPAEAAALIIELEAISAAFRTLPAIPLSGWKIQVAKTFSLQQRDLYECFFDVDGEPLLERLIGLAKLSNSKNLPILFQ